MTSSCGFNPVMGTKRRLLVGDRYAAENLSVLDEMKVTHIVSCGFETGFHQSLRRYTYMCLSVKDLPTANLLRHLPRVTSFIESALEQENGAVFVHCVHGQSRSCAVCVAYLMRRELSVERKKSSHISNKDGKRSNQASSSSPQLLHHCYKQVETSRHCMAINPGFVRQLEMFRRMGCGLEKRNSCVNRTPVPSRAHASFRAFRAKTEFHENGTIRSKFQLVAPSDTHSVVQRSTTTQRKNSNEQAVITIRCKKCRYHLFSPCHVLDDWTKSNQDALPACDYWKDSAGGKEYASQKHNDSNKPKAASSKGTIIQDDNASILIPIEPMAWMRPQFCDDANQTTNAIVQATGKLLCPGCASKIGSWDWNHPELFQSIFMLSSKVD